jgi:NADPH-dependent glutamate synthase beta subunit-like oxidoreductase
VIPKKRLAVESARGEVEALLGSVPKDRLHWRFGEGLGDSKNLEDILKEGFDAIFLAPGLMAGSALPGAKRPKEGVVDALTFLREYKERSGNGSIASSVAVLGGGNTAFDAAVTAKRLGAQDVYVVYRRSFVEMPGWPGERNEALEAGVHFLILTQPLDYVVDAQGRLTGLKIARTRLGKADSSGRRSPEVIPGSESLLEVGLVIEALGQRVDQRLAEWIAPVKMEKGLIKTSGGAATSVPGIFAGGDVVNGGTTAAQAVHEGYLAAAEIDGYLAGVKPAK